MSRKIEDLGEWYQIINVDGEMTSGIYGRGDVERTWDHVRRFLPKTLKGMRILDLGCNAGMYCVYSILMGAEEVVGIESQDFCFRQALFVKKYMEKKYDQKMNINYIHGKIEDHIREMAEFDIVYAFSIFYHLPDNVCMNIANNTRNVIARLRKKADLRKYSKIFGEAGFQIGECLREEGIKSRHLIQFMRP